MSKIIQIIRGNVLEKLEIIMRKIENNIVTETVSVSFDGAGISPSKPGVALVFPRLEIRLQEQVVYQDGKLVPMTHREFHTLAYLARHPNWVFSSDQIYEAIWEEDYENRETAVANIISQIRRKLARGDGECSYIATVIGSGYKFQMPE